MSRPDTLHYCNPQGRVIATFKIFLCDNQFYLQLPTDNIENTLNTLHKYAPFSKIDVQSADSDEQLDVIKQIEAGIPHITAATSEKFTPHMLNLPELNAVSFTKGCFIGQEVVARTEHLGIVKRKLYQATIDSEQIPSPGDKLMDEKENEVGIVVNAAAGKLLAVIKNNAVGNEIFFEDILNAGTKSYIGLTGLC